MNKRTCLIIFLLTCKICTAQNLIPNGDFELYSQCPISPGQLDSALYWINPSVDLGGASPDYLNQCNTGGLCGVPENVFGYQQAHSGVGYCGLGLFHGSFPNFREYAEVSFLSPLISNVCYHLEFYMNLSDIYGRYTTDDIGVYFSDTLIDNIPGTDPLPFSPQINNATGNYPDSANWILVSGNYVAAGGENYLIIGNFKNDLNTDTILADSSAFFQTSYVYIDDVSLTPCTGTEEQNINGKIKIYPNPVMNKLHVSVNNNELSEIILYDIASRKLLQQKFTNSISLNTDQLAKGIYLYEMRNKSGVIKKGKLVKE